MPQETSYKLKRKPFVMRLLISSGLALVIMLLVASNVIVSLAVIFAVLLFVWTWVFSFSRCEDINERWAWLVFLGALALSAVTFVGGLIFLAVAPSEKEQLA